MAHYHDRERKVHLFKNQQGRLQKVRHGGPVDNTLCAGNHGDLTLQITSKPSEVTCKRCLKLLDRQGIHQNKGVGDEYVDEHGTTWIRPTAWAYFAACRALHNLREQLRENGIEPRPQVGCDFECLVSLGVASTMPNSVGVRAQES